MVKREPADRRRTQSPPRIQVDTSEFVYRGAIVRIRLRNFMTYTDTEVRPGPNLNMILGPNGTGKSAVVCCIIVGLAGEVTLTGRGGSPADFVKKNTDWGSTEIELFNDKGANFIIERKIIITNRSQFKIDHKSEWRINGKTCLKTEVQKLTKKLNIKVDNLCQFLPQDSVTQFVKMNTCELLINTLKAAGDNQLVDDHQKLISLTKEVKEKRFALDNLTQAFKENEVNAKRLEAEVRQLRQRDELVVQRNICNQKIVYVRFCEEEAKCDAAAEEREKKKEELKEIESRSEPLQREINLIKTEVTKYRQFVSNSVSELEKTQSAIQTTQNAIENRKMDCQEEFSKFKGKEIQERDRAGQIRLKQQELESLECKLAESRAVDCTREIKKVEAEIDSVKTGRLGCNNEKHICEENLRQHSTMIDHIKREIEQIQAIREKKNSLLRVKFPEAFRVLEWLARNKQRFKNQIFSPILCEINVKDPKYQSIVEHAMSRQELSSFVCETEEDLRTFTRSVRDELNMRFNVILAPEKSVDESGSSQREDLSSLGVKAYLKDLIDAPEPIMNYLCGTNGFHKIPVADKCTEVQLQQLLAKIPKFYVGNSLYIVSRSRYDGKNMTVVDTIREAQHLIHSLDYQRLNDRRKRLTHLQAELEKFHKEKETLIQKEDQLKRDWQSLVEKHREFKSKHDQKKTLEQCIQRCNASMEKLQNEKIDVEAERRKLQQSIDKISREILINLEKLVEHYGKLVKVKELHMSNLLLLKLSERNQKIAQKRYIGAQRDTSQLAELIRMKGRALEEMRIKLEVLNKEVKEKIPGFKRGKLDPLTKKRFDTVHESTPDDLRAKVNELTARIQMIFSEGGNSVMSEYTRQTEELNDKKIRISELSSRVNEIDVSLNTIKKDWMPKLQAVIEVIDRHYREFMRKLKYDGHVKLDFDAAKPNNFSEYGIKILVKYRDNEQLIPLSSTRQSGGERSVATMIYMLALQTKTSVPFRCVDEINQGMDKENERKVFELLVQTADSSSSQYFLVSPKLLSNLPYSEKMKIHVVFNGKKLNLNWNDC